MKPRFTKHTKHQDAWILHARVSSDFKEQYNNNEKFQKVVEQLLNNPESFKRDLQGIILAFNEWKEKHIPGQIGEDTFKSSQQ